MFGFKAKVKRNYVDFYSDSCVIKVDLLKTDFNKNMSVSVDFSSIIVDTIDFIAVQGYKKDIVKNAMMSTLPLMLNNKGYIFDTRSKNLIIKTRNLNKVWEEIDKAVAVVNDFIKGVMSGKVDISIAKTPNQLSIYNDRGLGVLMTTDDVEVDENMDSLINTILDSDGNGVEADEDTRYDEIAKGESENAKAKKQI